MEAFSALLAICARNSPVTGEFPAQRPVTWSLDVFFDLRLKRLSKQWRGWLFSTPSRPLWLHRFDFTMVAPWLMMQCSKQTHNASRSWLICHRHQQRFSHIVLINTDQGVKCSIVAQEVSVELIQSSMRMLGIFTHTRWVCSWMLKMHTHSVKPGCYQVIEAWLNFNTCILIVSSIVFFLQMKRWGNVTSEVWRTDDIERTSL